MLLKEDDPIGNENPLVDAESGAVKGSIPQSPEVAQHEIADLEKHFNEPSATKADREANQPKEDFAKGLSTPISSVVSKFQPGSFASKYIFKLFGSNKKKAGSITSLIIIFILSTLTITSIPFIEIFQFGHDLEKNFAVGEKQSSVRGEKLLIYAWTGQIENTRLGILGTLYAQHMKEKRGLWIDYDEKGKAKTFHYDITKDSRYKDINVKERRRIQTDLMKQLKPLGVNAISIHNNVLTFSIPDKGNVIQKRKAINTFANQATSSKAKAAVMKRTLKKQANLSFNPITRLDNKYRELVFSKLIKPLIDKIKSSFSNQSETKSAPKAKGQESTEENPLDSESENNAKDSANQGNDAMREMEENSRRRNKLSPGDIVKKVGGGAALGVGIACIVQDIADDIDKARAVNINLPMMKYSMTMVSLPSKIMAGADDLDLNGIFVYWSSLHGFSKDNNSDAGQAELMQYVGGGKSNTGKELPGDLLPVTKKNPVSEFLGMAGALDKICSVMENTFVQIAGLILSPIQTAAFAGAMSVFFPPLMSYLEGYFAGTVYEPLVPSNKGSNNGNAAQFGAHANENLKQISMGGSVQNDKEATQQFRTAQAELKEELRNSSIASKYLDPTKRETWAGSVISKTIDSNISLEIAKLPNVFISSISSTVNRFALVGNANAKEQINNSETLSEAFWGAPTMGFSDASLASVENPYEASKKAKEIINNSGGENSKYVKYLKDCNHINVTGLEPNEELDFTPVEEEDEAAALLAVNIGVDPVCQKQETSDEFNIVAETVAYTQLIKATTCLEADDEESCTELGMASSDSGSDLSIPTDSPKSKIFKEINMTPFAIAVGRDAAKLWPILEEIGAWREPDGYNEHSSGLAADIMIPGGCVNGSNSKREALGDEIAKYYQENAEHYNIKYIIWKQRSWNAGQPIDKWKPMSNRGDCTQNHFDHVHVNVKGKKK